MGAGRRSGVDGIDGGWVRGLRVAERWGAVTPQHLFSKKQATCNGCFSRHSACSEQPEELG